MKTNDEIVEEIEQRFNKMAVEHAKTDENLQQWVKAANPLPKVYRPRPEVT